jgi:exosortase A-associated hydrolase 2
MLSVGEGYRFCLLRNAAPDVELRGGIVFVQPFAEEMNKSRRAVAVASRRLAADGWAVLQIDLCGCGDSSGDIANVRWQDWQDDVCSAASWLMQRGIPLRFLWGLRLGALLAASVTFRLESRPDLLLWQPVLNGKSHLTQFLRLKAFEEMLVQSGQQGATAKLRSALAAGNTVEVAGYTLGSALATAIDGAEFALPDDHARRILWLETGRADQTGLAPVSMKRIDALVAAGHQVTTRAVAGPSFWQTVEVEECPALVEATSALMKSVQPQRESASA